MMIQKTAETGGAGRLNLLTISGSVLRVSGSLTEACKNHLILQACRFSQIPVNTHTHI